ncbi:YutD family protein [Limosilactobacillus caecicola]|uniref:YutD family protein n=1 Tax=Limosilactobacillus caecicola TaxID=2941332 RepID=UPI00203F00A5|nr:YutD family protein [Limosilactobacillus caecicola]
MNRAKIQDYIDQRTEERRGVYHAKMEDEQRFIINNHPYEIVKDDDHSFDLDKFTDRFSMILSKFDYLVGDWGYGQLRLRGFYSSDNPLYVPGRGTDTIQDYLYEQCNFGCKYFIIHNLEVNIPRHSRRRRTKSRRRRRSVGYREKRVPLKEPNLKQRHHQEVKTVERNRQRRFVIKKRGE